MTRGVKYGILLTISFWIVAAPTCENGVSTADARRNHVIRLENASKIFTSESLSGENLKAFEFRAVEMLMDYADYLGIVYSDGYAQSFRQQARQNILGFFDSKENAEASLVPGSFPASCHMCQVMVDSIEVVDPLQRESHSRYTGTMEYVEKILGPGQADTSLLSRSKKTITITLQMDYKDFGDKSLLVWEILLGKMTAAE